MSWVKTVVGQVSSLEGGNSWVKTVVGQVSSLEGGNSWVKTVVGQVSSAGTPWGGCLTLAFWTLFGSSQQTVMDQNCSFSNAHFSKMPTLAYLFYWWLWKGLVSCMEWMLNRYMFTLRWARKWGVSPTSFWRAVVNEWPYLENADACLSFLLVIMKGLGVLYGMNVEKIYVHVKMSEKMGSFIGVVLMVILRAVCCECV